MMIINPKVIITIGKSTTNHNENNDNCSNFYNNKITIIKINMK